MLNDKSNMFDGMSIYVCTDALDIFSNEILPNISNSFYLVSGDSDACVPCGVIDIFHNPRELDESICLHIINHPKLIKWFAQNCIFKCDKNIIRDNRHVHNENTDVKVLQLPIGLDYHTISGAPDGNPGRFWRDQNEGSSTNYQEMVLKNIRSTMKPFHERIVDKICIVGMTITGERRESLNKIQEELLDIKNGQMPRTQVWKHQVNYAFVFSPHGGGLDCHRTWELLALGCIPIVKDFGSNKMFEDLPVLLVNDWCDITQKLLEDTLVKFKNKKFNYNKLFLKYWVDQFSSPPDF